MVASGLLLPARADAQGPNRVGLVVYLGDGNLVTRCVEFSEAEISGYDVLERAGLQVARRAEGMGSIVCSIQGVGCPVEDCFCQCKGSTCTYWSYWHLVGEQWSYSTLGADVQRVRSGDVEGWNWGEEEAPPLVPFDQICAPPAMPTPGATPSPTAPPTLVATATERPTVTPAVTVTRTPTVASVAAERPSPTPNDGVGTPRSGQTSASETTNYVLFGVLTAALLGVGAVILIQRRQ